METKEDANGSVKQMQDFAAEQPTGKFVKSSQINEHDKRKHGKL